MNACRWVRIKQWVNIVKSKQFFFYEIDTFLIDCSHAPVIEKCMADAIDSLKVCTGDVGRNDLDVVKSAVSGAIRYLCQNEGESLKSKSNSVLFIRSWTNVEPFVRVCDWRWYPLLTEWTWWKIAQLVEAAITSFHWTGWK